MTEQLYAVGDIGATNSRIAIYRSEGECVQSSQTATNPKDYEGSVQSVADTIAALTPERGEVVAASIAVAAEVSDSGMLTKSGALTPWVGKNLGKDLEAALGLPAGRVGTPNDVVAIAISQQEINLREGKPVLGIATTLSSGWGGALYYREGKTKSDEPGHQYLREGATCTCGERGHAEAFISGEGVLLNHRKTMEEWLDKIPGAREQLTIDISTATVAMIERHRATNDFGAEEVRWTGGVALGQPAIMKQVAARVREALGADIAPAFGKATMGHQAGLHGTLIDVQRRARQH